MSALNADQLQAAFVVLEGAAITGQRCPTNDQIPGGTTAVGALARKGRIRVEIGRLNYRVVYILTGPAAGKQTLLPRPEDWRPYLAVDKNGSRRIKRQADARLRR